MIYPKITIITPSYNQAQFLEQTILSVLEQNYSNLEYMIFDGGSTDNTVEIIKKYEKYLTFWKSEIDTGQANAINKGLEKATGEIFQWLNSDDYLEKGVLNEISEAFKNHKVDVVAGKTVYFKNNTFDEPIQQSKLSAKGLLNWDKGVKFVQPGVWLRRKKIIECGGIDETFHFAFDWDLYIRYFQKFPNVQYLDKIFVYFRLHENSKTSAFLDKFHNEEELILQKYSELSENDFLKKHSIKRLNRKQLYLVIEGILKNNNSSKTQKTGLILKKILQKPEIYFNKISFGALKNIIMK